MGLTVVKQSMVNTVSSDSGLSRANEQINLIKNILNGIPNISIVDTFTTLNTSRTMGVTYGDAGHRFSFSPSNYGNINVYITDVNSFNTFSKGDSNLRNQMNNDSIKLTFSSVNASELIVAYNNDVITFFQSKNRASQPMFIRFGTKWYIGTTGNSLFMNNDYALDAGTLSFIEGLTEENKIPLLIPRLKSYATKKLSPITVNNASLVKVATDIIGNAAHTFFTDENNEICLYLANNYMIR